MTRKLAKKKSLNSVFPRKVVVTRQALHSNKKIEIIIRV